MRWKKKVQPREYHVRIVTRFLFIPKCVDDEWRWLEWASVEQRYSDAILMDGNYYWRNVRWIDDRM